MQKTEQKTEQQAGLGMSFCEEEGRITVFRKTLEALELPTILYFIFCTLTFFYGAENRPLFALPTRFLLVT